MFTDISVSTDLNNKFNTHLKDTDVDLGEPFKHVLILTFCFKKECVLCRHQSLNKGTAGRSLAFGIDTSYTVRSATGI